MAHKIDLRDHGLFTGAGHHPLTFLEVPDRVYAAMSTRTGLPNRWRGSEYRRVLESEGLEVEMLITHVTGTADELIPHEAALSEALHQSSFDLVERKRADLARRFRGLRGDDLAALGVFLVARSPVGSSS
jgi:hypothetical protein